MDSQGVFCPNLACPARGQSDQGNIRVHSQRTQRYRCQVCGQTFTARKGTAYNFCTPHGTLSFCAHQPTTPAMAARLTGHCWSVEDLLGTRIPPPRWQPVRHRGWCSRHEQALIARWCA